MRVLIDTNILVRLANGKGDPLFGEASKALESLRRSGHIPTIVPQVLYEYWVVATRPTDSNGLGMSCDEADEDLNRLCAPLFRLLQDERAILERWRELIRTHQVSGKTAHDTRLVAAMIRHGLTHLLTFNEQDFARYQEIAVLTPRSMLHGESY